MTDSIAQQRKSGIRYAVAAFGTWGVLPLYWKMLDHVPAGQILAHRVFWSFVLVAILLFFSRRWHEVTQVFSNQRKFLLVLVSSILISINWFLYIWAVTGDRLVETSLGYYINPLFNVLIGVVFLRERLNFWQLISLALAASGVTMLTINYGQAPWLALVIAGTFALYGLTKKVTKLESTIALALETLLVSPIALGYLIYIEGQGGGQMAIAGLTTILLLMGAGVVTAMPLLWFAQAASRISLSTVGFMQYLSPTFGLFLGVVVYGEPFNHAHLLSFGLIWLALGLYSISNHPTMRRWQPEFIKRRLDPESEIISE